MINAHFATRFDLEQIARFNRTAAPFPDKLTLQELIEAAVDRNRSQVAVICDHDRTFGIPVITYGQLNERANQLAHLLRSKGIRPDDVVAIMLERSFAMIIGILGVIKAGAAYLPIPADNPPERTSYILKDAAVRVLLVQNKTSANLIFDGPVINLGNPETYQGSVANPSAINEPTDLAYVIYTSGSTGKPKGVMIEHRSVVNRLHWVQKTYPITERDVILQKTPYYFDVSVWELFWFALPGATLCFLPPGGEANPLLIIETVKKHGVSLLHFVPSMLNVFLEYLDAKGDATVEKLRSVRRIFASGETLSPNHVRKFNHILGNKTGARLTNLYGPTEATVDVSYFDCPAHNNFDTILIGRPIDNTCFYILRNSQQVRLGEVGELCIAGVGLARGYLNNPTLTQERFIDNPVNPGERLYLTGDYVRWMPDGNVEYLGREDSQVKVRGLRIELGEIENTIRGFSGAVDCAVVVRQYGENVPLIIAYIVMRGDLDASELRKYLKRHLPPYMIPNHFERIESIPLTPTGKTNRKALPEPRLGVVQLAGNPGVDTRHGPPVSANCE